MSQGQSKRVPTTMLDIDDLGGILGSDHLVMQVKDVCIKPLTR